MKFFLWWSLKMQLFSQNFLEMYIKKRIKMALVLVILLAHSLNAFKTFQPKSHLLTSAYNQDDPVYDLVIKDPSILASASEYAYSFWIRWSFTGPTYLKQKKQWHTIARLTSNEDHSNFQKGDRVLAVWLGTEYYHFTTYTKHNNNLYANINYGDHLEGKWNFIYFSYKTGSVKAYVWLASSEFQDITIQSNHLPLNDYMHFIIQKEFDCSLFNGYYSMIQLRIGEGSYLSDQSDVKKLAMTELALPTEFILNNEQGSLPVEQESLLEITDFPGRSEYSIFGWVKWTVPQNAKPYHFIVKLSLFKPTKNQEFTMLILKAPRYFHFATNDDYKEKKLIWNAEFSQNIEQSWSFLYFGYKIGKAFSLVKYATGEEQKYEFKGVKHYVPTDFIITLKRDDFFPPFSGEIRLWEVNFGNGGYTEKPIINFNMGKMKSISHDPISEEFEEEIQDVSGALEYSFGFWSKFLWNTEKYQIISKPKWMNVAHLSSHNALLSILLGQGYYQMIAEFPTVAKQVDYNQIDAKWVYIYFGYKRFALDKGNAFGWILHNDVMTVEFNILHAPVAKNLHFSVGSKWKGFPKFNGLFAKIKLLIGENAYFTSDQQIRKCAGEFPKIEAPKSSSQAIADKKLEEITNSKGQTEYSVELWFRQTGGDDEAKSCIYLMSLFDEINLGDNKKGGDRVLGLYQSARHDIGFHSYTSVIDNWERLIRQCQVNNLGDQIGWMYSYFGYSKKKGSIYLYLKGQNELCEGRMEAVHRVPNKLWLYVKNDGFGSNFKGRVAYLQVNLGYFKDGDFTTSQTYFEGAKLQPSQIEWKELAHDFGVSDWEKQDVVVEEFTDSENQVIDGQREYGYGFWSKYLTAFPHRLEVKPAWISVARLTRNKKHEQKSKVGDRLLGTMIGKGFYHFTTYEKFMDINYHNSLEGIWNFLYYSYKGSEAICFVRFGDSDEIVKASLNNLEHRVLVGYAKFKMGADSENIGFPGIVTGLIIRFDKGAFVESTSDFTLLSSQMLQKPLDHIKEVKKFVFAEKKIIDGEDLLEQEWPEEFLYSTEYSIFGWFKSSGVSDKRMVELMRLTNNEKSINVKDGYYTLCVSFLQNYELITYSHDKPAIKKMIPVENYLGSWAYFYMQYSFPLKVVDAVMWTPGKATQENFPNIYHMVPSYLAFYAGGGFNGKLTEVGAWIGRGAFKESIIQDILPSFKAFNPIQKIQQRDDLKNRMIIQGRSIQFEEPEQFSGATEYAFGVWTRWLQAYPSLLQRKVSSYSIVSLKSSKKLLFVCVAKGVYQFSSSDHQSANVPYSNHLEGQWNYVYLGYRRGKVAGFIHFTELKVTETINLQITHQPLLDMLTVSVMQEEFGSSPFHGELYDVIVRVGEGYIEGEDELKTWMYYQQMPDLPPAAYLVTEEKEFENKNYANSYSIQGWMKFGKVDGFQKRLVSRLTSNKVFSDTTFPGDRTLSIFMNCNQYKFSTYSLKNIDKFDSENDHQTQNVDYSSEVRFLWQHVYFGYDYNQKKGYGTVRLEEQVFETIFVEVYHMIPKSLYFYLGSDGILANFEGDLMNWDLHVGPGSYTEHPDNLIKKWPSAIQLSGSKLKHLKKKKSVKNKKKKK